MKSQCVWFDGSEWIACDPPKATHLKIKIPGPSGELMLPVMIGGTRAGTPNWTWNGSVEKPTLKPSVKTTGSDWPPGSGKDWICHTWITDGRAIFLPDTSHELKNQTVDLLDLD